MDFGLSNKNRPRRVQRGIPAGNSISEDRPRFGVRSAISGHLELLSTTSHPPSESMVAGRSVTLQIPGPNKTSCYRCMHFQP